MLNPQTVQRRGFAGVFSAAGANPPLRHTISIFKVTRLFARARAATTILQLAFPGKARYRTAVSAKITV